MSPQLSHFRGQLWVVRSEFSWRVGKHDNDSVDRTRDGTQKNTDNYQSGNQTNDKRNEIIAASQLGKGIIQPSVCHTDTTNGERKHKDGQPNGSTDEIIRNDRLPSAVSEQLHNTLSRLDVCVSVNTDVNKGPLVEILDKALKASQNALKDACDNSTVIAVSRCVGNGFQSLKNSYQ